VRTHDQLIFWLAVLYYATLLTVSIMVLNCEYKFVKQVSFSLVGGEVRLIHLVWAYLCNTTDGAQHQGKVSLSAHSKFLQDGS
jgi:hypothetical protein